MSDTDPYMSVEVASFAVPAPAVEPEAVEAPVTEEMIVPEGSVKKVLDWVGDDATRAQKALDAENSSDDKRTSLVSKLEAILN